MAHSRLPSGTAFVPVGSRVARFPPLAGDREVDVAIVGAGVTGLGVARLLAGSGLRVVVLEGHRVGGGTTGFSTGQLTSLVDDGYVALESDFGVDAAKAVAGLTTEAMNALERWVREDEIFCSLRRVPAFLFAETEQDHAELEKEAAAAARAGLGVRAIDPAEMSPSPSPSPKQSLVPFRGHPEAQARGPLRSQQEVTEGVPRFARDDSLFLRDTGAPCA